MSQLRYTTELSVGIIDQLFVRGGSLPTEPYDDDAVLRAIDDSFDSGRHVGKAGDVIQIASPVQDSEPPFQIEVWDQEPPIDDAFDHAVDVDLDVPEGKLYFSTSQVPEEDVCDVPPGHYRARVAGIGFDEIPVGSFEGGPESYRLQLWPRSADAEPVLQKAWAGWPE